MNEWVTESKGLRGRKDFGEHLLLSSSVRSERTIYLAFTTGLGRGDEQCHRHSFGCGLELTGESHVLLEETCREEQRPWPTPQGDTTVEVQQNFCGWKSVAHSRL